MPSRIKKLLRNYIDTNTIPNLLLTGTAGCGKGSLINAILEETGADSIFLNCSSDGRVEELRTTIQRFASSVSMLDGDRKKIVILDEIDGIAAASNLQTALRSFIEMYSKNALFILTGNNAHKIIPALHSRCVTIDYNAEISSKEALPLKKQFMKRLQYILDTEDVKYDRKVIAELISRNFPDFRKTINVLQEYATTGEIDSGVLIGEVSDIKELIALLQARSFDEVRIFVNNATNISSMYTLLYNELEKVLTKNIYASIILILAEYQYKDAFVADQSLNLMACLTEIMQDIG